MDVGYRETVLRSRPAQALVTLVVGICIITEVLLGAAGDVALLLRATAPLALVAVGSWALFWRPWVRVGPAEVELVNPLRTVTVTWPAIVDVETRWALVLVTAGGRWTAWSAPRSSAASASRSVRDVLRRNAVGASERRLDRDVGGAALAPTLVLQRWTAYRDDGLLGAVEGAGVRITWHVRTAVVLAALVVATIAAASTP